MTGSEVRDDWVVPLLAKAVPALVLSLLLAVTGYVASQVAKTASTVQDMAVRQAQFVLEIQSVSREAARNAIAITRIDNEMRLRTVDRFTKEQADREFSRLNTTIEKAFEKVDGQISDHETRLRSMERGTIR